MLPCHPERSTVSTKWTPCAVEGPAPVESTITLARDFRQCRSDLVGQALKGRGFSRAAKVDRGRAALQRRVKKLKDSRGFSPAPLACHPERSIASTKWTPRAVEGPHASRKCHYPRRGFPPTAVRTIAFKRRGFGPAVNPKSSCHSDTRPEGARRNLLLTSLPHLRNMGTTVEERRFSTA